MGYRHEGICFIKLSNNPRYLAVFTDDGIYVGAYTGIYEDSYYVDGYVKGVGLIQQADGMYYITKQGKVYTGGTLYLSDDLTNGLVPAGKYEFDENGKMVVKNGVIDGFYYEDGAVVKGKGIVKIGDDYYYVTQNGSVYAGDTLTIAESKTNGLIPAGKYEFDEDGKMILKNGIVDGYYYINGSVQKGAGVVSVNNDLYFIGQKGQVYDGTSFYIAADKTNDLIAPGRYNFDENCKIVLKNGIVDGYYYENGERMKGKGVILYNDNYYFINQSGAVFTGEKLFISATKTNDLIDGGKMYYFNADHTIIVD